MIVVDSFWAEQAGTAAALQRLAEASADPDMMLAYLDAERRIEVKRLRRVITARIAAARLSGDSKDLGVLAAADERWIMAERGASIPGFMRRVPEVFAAKPDGQPVRVVGMGDFGTGSQGQREVAAAIVRMGKAAPFDLGLTFGDNFYPAGMTGTDDTRWRDWWEALYGPLGITFYPSLGNHEWYSDDGAAAEIAYRSPTWDFPSPYYSFTAGPVQFFALDTTGDLGGPAPLAGQGVALERLPLEGGLRAPPDLRPGEECKGRQLHGVHAGAPLAGHPGQGGRLPVRPPARDGAHGRPRRRPLLHERRGRRPLGEGLQEGAGGPVRRVHVRLPQLEADAAAMRIAIFDTDGKTFDSEVITK